MLPKACVAFFSILCVSTTGLAQSNVVSNGSFENSSGASGYLPWTSPFGVNLVGDELGAEGRNYVVFYEAGSRIGQDVPTETGRSYIVRFAQWRSGGIRALWNGEPLDEGAIAEPPYAKWGYWRVHTPPATGNVSRVEFESVSGGGALDDVSVGWAEEPPSIPMQVPSRSVYEGGTVSFPAGAAGGPPLVYQWHFKNKPIAEETNRVLVVANATRQSEGEYFVDINSPFGEVRSLAASLLVHPIPNVPQVIFQPKSLQMSEGYFAGFFVFVVGSPPLFYQWQFNGTDIQGATDAHFSIPIVSFTNAGSYSVVVSNHFGTTASLPADLIVTSGVGRHGFVAWGNYGQPAGDFIDAPVFDIYGSVRLAGSNYSAQLYAGATSNSLHAACPSVFFGTNETAGYYFPQPVQIPDVPSGQSAYVQVRVWDNRFGETYEEARALGGSFGQSDIMSVYLALLPKALIDLRSYNLESGRPILATAKLYSGQKLPSGDREFILVGEVGAEYFIEYRTPPQTWLPLFVVTNTTGMVTFVDTNAQNASTRFYRAQILEQ